MATCYDCFHWKACRNILESMNHDLKGKKITICSTCEKFTPTTDVVEVVRCKDCKHYKYRMCELIGNIMDGYYHGTFDVKRPDDFCSYGVKKGGGEVCADD